MSYRTDRALFMSEKLVRASAVIGLLIVATAFAAFVPAPTIAAKPLAPGSDAASYQLDASVRRSAPGEMMAEIRVFAPDGHRVMSNSVTFSDSETARVGTHVRGFGHDVVLTPLPDGRVSVTLEVSDGSMIIHRHERIVTPGAGRDATAGDPISLSLTDADLHDVLKTLSELTGYSITADQSVSGNITVDVKDTPWQLAAARALASVGMRMVPAGPGAFRVVPAADVPRPEPPAGYLRIRAGIKAPEALVRIEPRYPEEARRARIAGIVLLEALIDETGVVKDVRVLKPLPFGLDQAAADAVRQWVFAPALLEGRPVPVVFNVTINFRPEPIGKPEQAQ